MHASSQAGQLGEEERAGRMGRSERSPARERQEVPGIVGRARPHGDDLVVTGALALDEKAAPGVPGERVVPREGARDLGHELGPGVPAADVRQLVDQGDAKPLARPRLRPRGQKHDRPERAEGHGHGDLVAFEDDDGRGETEAAAKLGHERARPHVAASARPPAQAPERDPRADASGKHEERPGEPGRDQHGSGRGEIGRAADGATGRPVDDRCADRGRRGGRGRPGDRRPFPCHSERRDGKLDHGRDEREPGEQELERECGRPRGVAHRRRDTRAQGGERDAGEEEDGRALERELGEPADHPFASFSALSFARARATSSLSCSSSPGGSSRSAEPRIAAIAFAGEPSKNVRMT